jgi:hypothetical protein
MADQKKKKKISQAKYAMSYPAVMNAELVGTYEPSAYAGGGFVWDEVLEYRVWCLPECGAPDVADGSDYDYPLSLNPSQANIFTSRKSGLQNGRWSFCRDREGHLRQFQFLHLMRHQIG